MNTGVPGELEAGVPSCVRVGSSVTVVCRDGGSWELKGNAAVVVAWVALEGRADRRRVSATLWPQSDAGQARSNLRVLTHRINQRFGGELLAGNEHLELDAALAHVESHDAESLLAALAAGGAARCEPLAEVGLEATAGSELQAWLEGARQRLKRVQLACLREALAQAIAVAEHERAVMLARACVQIDPLSEQGHRQLMEVLVRAGDRAAALAAYEQCKAELRQHLGVLPDVQTRSVHLRILQEQALGSVPGGPQALEADGSATLGGAPCYPLVEREAVLRQAQAALEQGAHLVLHGEPGVGKTRLLRHLAAWAGDDAESVAIGSVVKQEPYAAVAQLLLELQPRRAPRLGVPEQIELARLAPMAFAGVKPSEAPMSVQRLHAALRHWLAQLGDAGVRVLLIDDVQYADAASQAALASLLQGAPEAAGRVPALLLGHRSGELEAVLDQAVTDAQTRLRARRIELSRLTPAGVLALLRAMDTAQRAGDPEALAQQLHRRTGGNPLFVIELARQSLEQGHAADVADLQALLGANLQRCGELAQQLAAVAAVAAEDFSVELAAAVSGHNALALMPAWRQLQQRGLFAGQGLAHDLVRDAVLAGLPQAILQELHRQVGQVLEGHGAQGTAVLRHWLAAADFDRALPHAAQQLYVVAGAGLPTRSAELELLALMERVSDRVLLANLWYTAEIASGGFEGVSADLPRRVQALRQRVQRMPEHAEHAAWIAYGMSDDLWRIDHDPKRGYEVLAAAADRMPLQGVERAFVEFKLAELAVALTGDAKAHVSRAMQALLGLPDQPAVRRLRLGIDRVASIYLEPVEALRMLADRWRSGRRRHDLAAVEGASMLMGSVHGALGSAAQSWRDYCRAARQHPGDGDDIERFQMPFSTGKIALNVGHFALAERLLAVGDDHMSRSQRPLFLAVLHLRLGNPAKARWHVSQADPHTLSEHFSTLIVHFHVRAELERCEGRDPSPVMRQLLDHARERGTSGINLGEMSWELALQGQSAAERLVQADALLVELRSSLSNRSRLAKTLLQIAETHLAGNIELSRSLATEAARWFRRGFANATLYLPEYLVRCARLLRAHDPRESDALVQVARRWVCHALQQLPPGAEEGFTRNVAVNRLLLGEDNQALYVQPLH